MKERAQMLGGEFTLEAKPGKGTRLTVELPLTVTGASATSGAGGVS
jgi:chemotaxis protein histidine kinase CheA